MAAPITDAERASLDELYAAVDQANDAWFDKLYAGEPDKAEKDAYQAAKLAYRTYEAELIEFDTLVTCGRCGGSGYVEWGIGDKTCFRCLGARREVLRKAHLPTEPKTRLKNQRKAEAQQAIEAEQFESGLAQLPEEVGQALVAAEQRFEEIGGFYSDTDDRALTREEEFRYDLAQKLRKFGSLSEKQVAAVQRGIERDAKRAADEAALATAPPLAGGTCELVGEIVSDKHQETRFGWSHKMLVKLDDHNKVWGTVPAKLADLTRDDWDSDGNLSREGIELRGLRISFTAQVERSSDDPHFGFFKRPTKVKVLEVAV